MGVVMSRLASQEKAMDALCGDIIALLIVKVKYYVTIIQIEYGGNYVN